MNEAKMYLEVAVAQLVTVPDEAVVPKLLVERDGSLVALGGIDPPAFPAYGPLLLSLFEAQAVALLFDSWTMEWKDPLPEEHNVHTIRPDRLARSPKERFDAGEKGASEALMLQHLTTEGVTYFQCRYKRWPGGLIECQPIEELPAGEASGRITADAAFARFVAETLDTDTFRALRGRFTTSRYDADEKIGRVCVERLPGLHFLVILKEGDE